MIDTLGSPRECGDGNGRCGEKPVEYLNHNGLGLAAIGILHSTKGAGVAMQCDQNRVAATFGHADHVMTKCYTCKQGRQRLGDVHPK